MALQKIKYFSLLVNKDKFFKELQAGDLFRFSDGYLYKEVEKMADRRGVVIRYCPPRSPAYEMYGCQTAQVVQDKLVYEPQIFHFHIKHLDI